MTPNYAMQRSSRFVTPLAGTASGIHRFQPASSAPPLIASVAATMLNDPQQFEMALSDGWYRLSRASLACKFAAPASTRGIAKLYTISSDDSLLYVGVAQQPMAARLSNGFKANGQGGYHGYKWKFLESTLTLTVWTAKLHGVYASIRELETVEAEVAYICRSKAGQWPTHQHEIHFYPSEERHRDAALHIYNYAVGKSC